jgi:hypothetical protein
MELPSLNIDWTQVIMAVLMAVTGGFGMMWRQAVAESKRKDQLIDKLTEQVMRTADGNIRIADAQMQMVTLHERDRR